MRPNTLLTDVERNAVLELRHTMHREPELSNQEGKTQERILAMLDRFGITGARVFHNTGVYVDIVGRASGEGRSIAVRGDIDALPIQEARDDLPYRSQVPGVMHACGHDMHGSIALGTALAFSRMRDNFAGKVRVFFHPAEEAEPVGGRSVEREALLHGFDHAIGFHVSPDIPAGTFGASEGAVTKSADQFRLTFTGTMSHGAAPYRGVDAIAIAAAFVNEVQKVVSREMLPDDGAVVTVGTIHGGEASNIICPSVVLEGTIRTKSAQRRPLLTQRVRDIAAGVATMHRGHADCVISTGEPPVINDAELVRRFRQLVSETVGKDHFRDDKTAEGSDDFGFYSAQIPAIYFWFGSREPGNESGLHTPTFGASDSLLIPTTELTIKYCLSLLNQGLDAACSNQAV
ncbi:MAG: amidohydrolase [Mesorhizobium sp.]|uniref:M20 metallopeptidase family protein n=1 Tax=Mesorhizobium sp. TaxID=1871066 RepID=UPI000FE7EAAC|nr:M20 family metallopeptidase [Mesorhizobium sp.]RWM51755.1 MAG: amidohydrolase [Mesorhizobium sp.]RWM89189.1 MAG: amidohydrolase [Mesorhizobium sp.]